MVAAFTIVSALYRRRDDGDGELIDVALLEAGLALMAPRIASYLAGAPEPEPSGATDSVLAVYQPFPTADRPIAVAVGNDEMWRRFCRVLDLELLESDAGLATNADRRDRRAELISVIRTRLEDEPASAWLERFAAAGIPSAPIKSLSEVVADPHVAARDVIAELEHPAADSVRVVGAPWQLGTGRPSALRPPPQVGNDTTTVLHECGYSAEELAELVDAGVVWAAASAPARVGA
jgi:crotonobetainyl-CoA:carnitine CoA-transferase CaiB-like acyl-CoA transferase